MPRRWSGYSRPPESLSEMLLLFGHEVHAAHDGSEAVAAAERFRPEVILMDVGMPKLNGLDATHPRAVVGQGMTVIALTGWGQDGTGLGPKKPGVTGTW